MLPDRDGQAQIPQRGFTECPSSLSGLQLSKYKSHRVKKE